MSDLTATQYITKNNIVIGDNLISKDSYIFIQDVSDQYAACWVFDNQRKPIYRINNHTFRELLTHLEIFNPL